MVSYLCYIVALVLGNINNSNFISLLIGIHILYSQSVRHITIFIIGCFYSIQKLFCGHSFGITAFLLSSMVISGPLRSL